MPAAPITSTVSPARRRPRVMSMCHAVPNDTWMDAALSKEIWSGNRYSPRAGTHHELGVRTRVCEAGPERIGAEVVATGGAERAVATDDVRRNEDAVTRRSRRHVRADGLHDSGSLHPKRVRNVDFVARGAGQKIEIEVVDGGGQDAHERFIASGSPRRDLLESEPFQAAERVEPDRAMRGVHARSGSCLPVERRIVRTPPRREPSPPRRVGRWSPLAGSYG